MPGEVDDVKEALMLKGYQEWLALDVARTAVRVIKERNDAIGKIIVEATQSFIAECITQEAEKHPDKAEVLQYAVEIVRTCGYYTNRGTHDQTPL